MTPRPIYSVSRSADRRPGVRYDPSSYQRTKSVHANDMGILR